MTGSTNWRPIETAPKDGTVVDLWVRHTDEEEREPDCWWVGNLGSSFGEWVRKDPEGYYSFEKVYGEATHWMPLPEPPS